MSKTGAQISVFHSVRTYEHQIQKVLVITMCQLFLLWHIRLKQTYVNLFQSTNIKLNMMCMCTHICMCIYLCKIQSDCKELRSHGRVPEVSEAWETEDCVVSWHLCIGTWFIYSCPPLPYGFGTFGGRSIISYLTSFQNISWWYSSLP